MNEAEQFRHFWKNVQIRSEFYCWYWTGGMNRRTGYGLFRQLTAHRYAWILTFGEIKQDGLMVCHKCDCRICVNPNHLFLGTNQDNVRDAVSKGRHSKPPSSARITPDNVRFIRSIWVPYKMSMAKISKQYGFPYKSVENAVRSNKWQSVK